MISVLDKHSPMCLANLVVGTGFCGEEAAMTPMALSPC
jgi:hypothetical protein